MKLAVFFSLIASAAAFSQESSRREALSAAAAAAGVAFVPAIANAAAGESPRFSVFGLVGDGTAYSEGAAYGSDQSSRTYSPYSVYGKVGDGIYSGDEADFKKRKVAVLVESKKRVARLPAYIEKKKWYEVRNELGRYMYETRGAVRGLAESKEQKKAAAAFFKAIEDCDGAARLRQGDKCAAAATAAASALDAFSSLV